MRPAFRLLAVAFALALCAKQVHPGEVVRPGGRLVPCDLKPLGLAMSDVLPGSVSVIERSLVRLALRIENPSNCRVGAFTLNVRGEGADIFDSTYAGGIPAGRSLHVTATFRAPATPGSFDLSVTALYQGGSSQVTSVPFHLLLRVFRPSELDEALRLIQGMNHAGMRRARLLLDHVSIEHPESVDTSPRYHTLRGITAAIEAFSEAEVEVYHCEGLDDSCYHPCGSGWCYEPDVRRFPGYGAALVWINQALFHDPFDVEAHYWKWRILYFARFGGEETSDAQKTAVEACVDAYDSSTIPAGLRDMYGGFCRALSAHLKGGDLAPHRLTVERSLRQGSPPALTHFLLGWIDASAAQRTGKAVDWNRAIGSFTTSLERDPGVVHNRYYRGLSWDKVGRKDNCLNDLYDFLALAPDAPQAGIARAIVCRNASHLPACQSNYEGPQ